MTSGAALTQLLIERITSDGPLRFSEFVAQALYHPDFGFYATEGRAGRRGDFITSPEVGPLFGVCLGRYLDEVWDDLGRPAAFVVVEAGAGPGTLARSIRASEPACLNALRYVAVEISAAQRDSHPDWVESVGEMPAEPAHVVMANELLDNLPFDIAVKTTDGWSDVLVDAVDGEFVEMMAARNAAWPQLPSSAALGARLPILDAAVQWCAEAVSLVDAGRVLLLDYASPTDEIIGEPDGNWVRTYRANERGDHPLLHPGTQDITTQIPIEQLRSVDSEPPTIVTQAAFLERLGIEDLVADGRAIWQERAHLGDLTAMKARSRISEAESLLDPAGLGAFLTFEWRIPK